MSRRSKGKDRSQRTPYRSATCTSLAVFINVQVPKDVENEGLRSCIFYTLTICLFMYRLGCDTLILSTN